MTRIIGVLNYKGGTAKTTTVVNLAAGLAMRGARVLCIDLDAQGGLATYLGVRYTYSVTHLLLGQASPEACVFRARDNLDIIASDRNLLRVEGELWQLADRWKARQRLAEKVGSLTGYDYIFFDFSPSVSLLGESGLLCVKELIVPVTMGYLALVGTRQVIETLKSIGHVPNHTLSLSYVVPTYYRGQRRKDREIIEMLRRYFGDRVTSPIRENVKLSEAPGHSQTIYEYAPRSSAANDYSRLVERVANDA
jgi:chromosome partitioning protein